MIGKRFVNWDELRIIEARRKQITQAGIGSTGGGGGSASFTDVTISGLTASLPVVTDAAKQLTSMSWANFLGGMSGQAAAAFDWNAQALTNVGAIAATGLTLSGMTPGQVAYYGVGGLMSGSAEFTWDNTNKRFALAQDTTNYAVNIGVLAGRLASTGRTVNVGYTAGYVNTTGHSVNVGYRAGRFNTTAHSVNVGYTAGFTNTTGSSVNVGYEAGYANTTGYSVNVGYRAGYGTTTANAPATDPYGILIGYEANRSVPSATVLDNYIGIGYGVLIDKSNQVKLGNTDITETQLYGNIGIHQATFGTNAAKVWAQALGTAPTTSPADCYQAWCGDIDGAAGKAGMQLRYEHTGTLHVGGIFVKADAGDPAYNHNGLVCINTNDTNEKIYANAAWKRFAFWGQDVEFNSVEVDAAEAYYFGDKSTNDSWRIIRDGDDLSFERREAGAWVSKDVISA
jgi:hypothetical protein